MIDAEQNFSALRVIARSTALAVSPGPPTRKAELLGTQGDRALDGLGGEPRAADAEVRVDAGEDFGVGLGTLGGELHLAQPNVVAALVQDVDDVELGAAAHAEQQHLHRASAQIASAVLGWAVHDHRVPAARLGHHQSAFHPLHARFHVLDPAPDYRRPSLAHIARRRPPVGSREPVAREPSAPRRAFG